MLIEANLQFNVCNELTRRCGYVPLLGRIRHRRLGGTRQTLRPEDAVVMPTSPLLPREAESQAMCKKKQGKADRGGREEV